MRDTSSILTDIMLRYFGFTNGFVEYVIPNFIPGFQKITQISITMELSSEAPGVNSDWPSDIEFYLNDKPLGCWTSPGDFGDVKGLFHTDLVA